MRMCVYRSAARRPLQMERLAQTLLCCVAVRYDCFYQRRVPTTVGQWVAKLANGTNGAAQRQAAQQPQLALLVVPYRPLAQPTWSQSHHTRLEEYEGVWQRALCHFNGVLQPGSLRAVPSHTLVSAHNL